MKKGPVCTTKLPYYVGGADIMWVGLAEKRGGAGCILNLLHSKFESLNIRH
jgi:hypothetical protein